jgi:hypothetical protein
MSHHATWCRSVATRIAASLPSMALIGDASIPMWGRPCRARRDSRRRLRESPQVTGLLVRTTMDREEPDLMPSPRPSARDAPAAMPQVAPHGESTPLRRLSVDVPRPHGPAAVAQLRPRGRHRSRYARGRGDKTRGAWLDPETPTRPSRRGRISSCRSAGACPRRPSTPTGATSPVRAASLRQRPARSPPPG